MDYKLSEKLESDIVLNFGDQPKSFYDNTKFLGGQISLVTKYYFKYNFSGFVGLTGKTKGWTISNPYLQDNITVQFGLNFNLRK